MYIYQSLRHYWKRILDEINIYFILYIWLDLVDLSIHILCVLKRHQVQIVEFRCIDGTCNLSSEPYEI